MGIYTLDTDFSSLNVKKANTWILRLRDMTEDALVNPPLKIKGQGS